MKSSYLLGFLFVFSNHCQAQLPNDKGVAPSFLNWEVAWGKLSTRRRERFEWIPKAIKQPWRQDEATLSSAEQNVVQLVKQYNGNLRLVADQCKQQALQQSNPVSNFKWGYSQLLLYKQNGDISASFQSQEAMSRTFTPNLRYVRLLFLLANSWDYGTPLIPVGERLMHQFSQDEEVARKMIQVLESVPTLSARKQGVALINKLISLHPNHQYYWAALGGFYDQWWLWNRSLARKAASISDANLASNFAKRDARLAISAYQRSINYAPAASQWRTTDGPSLIKRITDWQAKNP